MLPKKLNGYTCYIFCNFFQRGIERNIQSTFFSLGDGSIDNDGKYIFERVASLAALSILVNIIIQIFMTKTTKKE